MNFDRVFSVLRAFDKEAVHYVLVGGVALNLHGLVRATQNINFFLSLEPANIERAKAALRAVFADPEIDKISAEDLEAEEHLIDGVRVHVATPATLYRMKKDTLRPIDRADAEALKRRFKLGGA